MAKTTQIEWSGSIGDRIDFACRILGISSAPEIFVVKTLFEANQGKATPLSLYDRNVACIKGGVNINTFNGSLARLMKKDFVLKVGDSYQLHPIFIDLDKTDSITIKWK